MQPVKELAGPADWVW